ncbi:hypothetical protein [Lacinutrix undariae]
MTLLDSPLAKEIERSYHQKIGDFYFFKHFVVIEYAEDIVVKIEDLKDIILKSKDFYTEDQNFGLIVNQINNYATSPADAMKLEQELPNLTHTAVVNASSPSAKNFDLENHFFKNISRCLFVSIEDAQAWILNTIDTE